MRITPSVSLPEIAAAETNSPLIISPSVEKDSSKPVATSAHKRITSSLPGRVDGSPTPVSIAIPFSTRHPVQVIETNSHSDQFGSRHVSTSRSGFLWKPVSENDGKLVVLLPQSITDQVKSTALYTSLPPHNNTLIESGRFTGDTHNGGRAHYRFSKAGKEYPDEVFVVAELKDGSYTSFKVNGSGNRNS